MKDYKKKLLASSEVLEERTRICNECEHRKGKICSLCGCVLPLKRQLKKSECPDGRW